MAFRKSTSASKRAAEIFSSASGHARERAKAPSLLLRLYRGEVSLIRTFWTFFLSLPLLGDMIFTQFIFPMLDVESSEGTAAMFVWGTFMLVYGIIASIGLWRSACRYTGPSHWALLAKACAVLGMGASVAYALMWYGSWMILANA
jgi:hypothetical protein